MKKIITILFAISSLIFCIRSIFAQEDIATPEAEEEHQAEENESSKEDKLRETVREKIEAAKNKPKAYLGTVTDISEDTLQIKSKDEIIQLISLNDEETTFAQSNGSTQKADFEDLAIGDYTVSMGYINDGDVLEAKRVLITSALTEPARKIVFGQIKNIVKKEITITSNTQNEIALVFPKSWKGPEIADLEAGMNIVCVYQPENGILTIRTIEIVNVIKAENPLESED